MMTPMKSFLKRVLEKDKTALNEFQKSYQDILNCLYSVSNPIMIKQVMYLKKIIRSPELRLPLCEPEDHLIQKMKQSLKIVHP